MKFLGEGLAHSARVFWSTVVRLSFGLWGFRIQICRIIGYAFASVLIAALAMDLLDEVPSLAIGDDEVFFLLSMPVIFFLLVQFLWPVSNFERSYDPLLEMRAQIQMAKNSKLALSVLLVGISGAALIFAAQAVIFVAGDIQETPDSARVRESRDVLLLELTKTHQVFSSLLSPTEVQVASYESRVEKLNKNILDLGNEIRAYRAATETINPDGTVKQVFIFQFFSSIAVRLGTLGILLLLFGVALRQYRRYDRQIFELRQVQLAVHLAHQGIEAPKLLGLREAVSIDDDAKPEETNKVDSAFMTGYADFVSLVSQKVKEAVSKPTAQSKD